MSKTSKILLTELFEFIYLLSKRSKMVFAAFTQMYTDIMYCIHAPHPSKREGSLFKEPPVLWV